MHRFSTSLGPRNLSLDSLFSIIIDNLESKSPKISWNACVALANILENPTLTGSEHIFSDQTLRVLFKQLDISPNFKTKIHSATTLLKFKNPKAF